MVKKLLLCMCAIFATTGAYADYYRATGGGVYELYVNDCSASGMRHALDNAVAARRAVITSVKCAASDKEKKHRAYDFYTETIPVQYLCPCALIASPCGC